jgi:hypothetical protein
VQAPSTAQPVAHKAKRQRGVFAFATFACDGRLYQTENGTAETLLPHDAPERELLEDAGQQLVDALEARTSYTPILNSVLLMRGDDAAKRMALACHAEKKALGALVRRSADGRSTLRVGVNIRMCRDCHAAFAAASELFQRPLECDDAANLHRFEGGVCSCGDRWR